MKKENRTHVPAQTTMGGTVAGVAPRPSCRWPALISPALLGFALLVFYTNVGQPPHAESEQDTEKQCRCAPMVFQRGGQDITATCANPDNDPDGDWCFVEDETCQGAPWGYCAAPALADALDGQTHRSCVVIEGDPKPFC